jgi:hypothetical protein
MTGLSDTTIRLIRAHPVEFAATAEDGRWMGHIVLKQEGEPARMLVSSPPVYVSPDDAVGGMRLLADVIRRVRR